MKSTTRQSTAVFVSAASSFACGTRVPRACVDRHRDEAGRAVAYRRMQAGHVLRKDLEEHRDWSES
jgi:hypothetical protein